MKKKLALAIASGAALVALLVPMTSQADDPCVVIDGPSGLHIQVGYAPNGPDTCTHLPG